MATADGADDLRAQDRAWQAHRALNVAGRFGRPSAARTVRGATEAHGTMEEAVLQQWGGVPHTAAHLPFWAEAVAEQLVRADPRVVEAQQAASSLSGRVTELRGDAQQALHNIAEIDALPVTEAARLARAAGRWPYSPLTRMRSKTRDQATAVRNATVLTFREELS